MELRILTWKEHKERLRNKCYGSLKLLPVVASFESVIVFSAMTLASFGARWWWAFDLLVHFRLQYAVLLFFGFLSSLYIKARKSALLAGACCLINCFAIVPYVIPRSAPVEIAGAIKVASVNVLTSNTRFADMRSYLTTASPDIVVLTEIHDVWAAELAPLKSEFPHHFLHPRPDNFGIGIISKHPLKDPKVLPLGKIGVPCISTDLEIDGKTLHVLGVHTLPPVGRSGFAERNRGLEDLGKILAQHAGPKIVVGDLNTTPHSPFFQDFIAQNKLIDSSLGQGLQYTWSTQLPFVWVTIDHVLYSGELELGKRTTGPKIGSDHWPVLVELAWRR